MNRIKRLTPLIVTSIVASTQSQFVSASDSLRFIPQVAVQQKNLDFTQSFVGGSLDGFRGGLDADLPTIAFSFTTVYDRFFFSLKHESNYADSFSDSEVAFSQSASEVDRNDLSITVGANIWKGLNGFAGYIVGKTTIKPEPKYVDATRTDGTFLDYNVDCYDSRFQHPELEAFEDPDLCLPLVRSNLSKDHFLQGLAPYKQTYREEGMFFGVSYGQPIADVGTLTGSAAYAIMDGQYRDNFQVGTSSELPFLYKGDSKGSSLALTWTAPLNKTMNYYFDLRRQTYDMTATNKTGIADFDATVKTKETMTTFTLGVQAYL